MLPSRVKTAALLLQLAACATSHGDEHDGMDMGGMKTPQAAHQEQNTGEEINNYDAPSYYGLASHGNLIMVHIVVMVVAWCFVLPLGVMWSTVRSRFALPTQFLFLVLNAVGVLFGTVYNINTPDLYVNNAHHKIGWIGTWVMVAQVVMSLLFTYSGRNTRKSSEAPAEAASFLPMSIENMAQHNMRPYTDYRWSGDSGQGTERSSDFDSRDGSPTDPHRRNAFDTFDKPEPEPESDDDDEGDLQSSPPSPRAHRFRIAVVDKFLSARIPNLLSNKALRVVELLYDFIDRTILVLAFIALTSGGVTYAGIFRGANVFNGLAHFVKGGIFFWYGLLTLGRWMGCFAHLGWAWNVKPSQPKSRLPSAEFVESFVIWLYGTLNVFLEHLAAWGGEWTAQDLEHVSISIMFFGGGLCGMLVESKHVRHWLNFGVEKVAVQSAAQSSEGAEKRSPPRSYGTSLNPMPALIILLLGIMMSSHHQSSVVSTMVHKQWGNLLIGFSFARMATYLLTYLSPPTSIYPSRPPTELLSAFCLISGGLVFMASTKDIIHYMETADLMAMFVFTVAMGLTAFIMAYEIILLSLRGWAARREMRSVPGSSR